MNINFELYKVFYFVAKYKSFSLAAKKLYITQSAVSQSIKNLEIALDSTLFYRKNRKISLTYEGELLFEHVEKAYNALNAAEYKFAEIHGLKTGEIKIGASDTVCKYHLIDYLESFNEKHPNIKIQVINRTSPQIIDLLKRQSIDMGIITLPVDDKGIDILNFAEVQDIFVASYKFAPLKEQVLTFEDLSKYPLLFLEKNSQTRQNMDLWFKKEGVHITPEIELESIDLLLEFAKIGLGISCVLSDSAISAIEKKQLFEVRTIKSLPPRRLGICTLKDVPLSKAAQAFIGGL